MDPMRPLTYEEVDELASNRQRCKIKRCVTIEEQYNQFCQQICKEWQSVSDFILFQKMGITTTTNIDNNKKKIDILSYNSHLDKVYYQENEFPFNTESDILQYVVWKVGTTIHESDIIEIVDKLRVNIQKQFSQYVYIDNDREVTGSEVRSATIFIKVKSDAGSDCESPTHNFAIMSTVMILITIGILTMGSIDFNILRLK
jgi:hypothetical protein